MTPQAATDSTAGGRAAHRWIAWAALGAVGALGGIVFAAGAITSETVVDGTNAAASEVFGTPAAEPQTTHPYQGLVSTRSTLVITIESGWGVIANDHALLEIDLTAYSGTSFQFDVLVDNEPTDWTTAQLKWLQLSCPDLDSDGSGADDLTSADFDTAYAVAASADPGTPKLMDVNADDADATFPSIAGGSRYCFGIKDMAVADDAAGTYLDPVDAGSPVTPTFTGLLNEAV